MTAALLLAAALPAAAGPAECSAAYKPEHSVEWDISRADWDAHCAKGLSAADALRLGQRASLARCMARFSRHEESGKLPKGEAAALCAQGADGRARLAERTGERAKLPAAAPAPPAVKPGASLMGPFGRALEVARAWRPDACFAGLFYDYIDSTYIPIDEWKRAREEGRTPNRERTELEEYAYHYHSPSQPLNSYRVSFGDKMEAAFCYKVDRLDGPDASETALVAGLDGCLGPVEVDLPTALDVAAKNGFVVDPPLKAYLARFPPGHFQRACRGSTSKYAPVDCGDLATWDAAKFRRAMGKPVWILSAGGKTAFVDALGGRFRYLAPGPVNLRAGHSHMYAEGCLEDKKGGPFGGGSED